MGNTSEAMEFAEKSLATYERLVALDPTNVTRQNDLKFGRAMAARLGQ